MRKAFSIIILLLVSVGLFASVGYTESIDAFVDLFSEVIADGEAVAFVAMESDSIEFRDRFWSDIEYSLMDKGIFVLDRRNNGIILEELYMQTSGIVDDSSAVSIGKSTGASHLIFGEARNMISYFSVKLRLVDAETGKVERIKSFDIRYDDDLKRSIEAPGNVEGSKRYRIGIKECWAYSFLPAPVIFCSFTISCI